MSDRDFYLTADNDSRRKRWLSISSTTATVTTATNNIDDAVLDQIQRDLHRSYPEILTTKEHIESLESVLLAFVRYNSNIAYCQGMNFIAAVCLHVTHYCESEALQIFIYIIEHHAKEYFTEGLIGLQVDISVLFSLLKEHIPDVASSFESAMVPIDFCCTDTIMTLFVHKLPLNCLLVLWDAMFSSASTLTSTTSASSTSPNNEIFFGALLHFFDLHRSLICESRNDPGQLMDDLKMAVSQYSQESNPFDIITGALHWSKKIPKNSIHRLREKERIVKTNDESKRILRIKSWNTDHASEIMDQLATVSKLRLSILNGNSISPLFWYQS